MLLNQLTTCVSTMIIYGTCTPNVGCREAVFALKTLLHAKRSHGLKTHIAFINQVKAYATADHELLIKCLKSMESRPLHIRKMVASLYENLVISLIIGSETVELH